MFVNVRNGYLGKGVYTSGFGNAEIMGEIVTFNTSLKFGFKSVKRI